MARISLNRLVTARRGTAPKRRVLRAVRPSRSAELAYRSNLASLVAQLRKAGTAVADALKDEWIAREAERAVDAHPSLEAPNGLLPVRDAASVPPSAKKLLDQAARKFGNVKGLAKKWADAAAKQNLGDVDGRLTQSIRASLGIDVERYLTTDGPISTAMRAAISDNVDLIASIPEQYLGRIEKTVTEGWTNGIRWEELVEAIAADGDVTENRAALIARDQTSKMNSAFNRVRQTDLGIKRFEWQTAGDERVRESHADLDGQVFEWDDPPTVDDEVAVPGQPINCFPGDSRIQFAHGVEKSYRRRYRGELAEIVTASGKSLRATPNHPVLTLRGWIPIGQLDERDHVIEVANQVIGARKDDGDDGVPTIRQVFQALAGGGTRQATDVAVADFHGDATDGQVDIVFAARPLLVDAIATRAQGCGYLRLSDTSNARFGHGAAPLVFGRVLATAYRFVRGIRQALALIWFQARHANGLSLAYAAAGNACLGQASLDGESVDIEAHGNGQLAFSGQVGCDDGRSVELAPIPGRPTDLTIGDDAALAEALGNGVGMESDRSGRLRQGLPFVHQASRVVETRRIDGWSGHVFNLETAVGWYVSNGIVTHNCRCVAGPVFESDEDEGGGDRDDDDLQEAA